MTTRNLPNTAARQQGGTAAGFLVGVVVGLLIAVVVAFVTSRAPMPFLNKSAQINATRLASESGRLPDPNVSMYRDDGQNVAAASGERALETVEATRGSASYMLQAGAFRNPSDAEAMRARLALMGFEGEIQSAKVNDQTLFRVRLGPYARLDDINDARSRLAREDIEASVVRQ